MLDKHEPLTEAEKREIKKPLDETDLMVLQALVTNSMRKLKGGYFKYRRVLSLKLADYWEKKTGLSLVKGGKMNKWAKMREAGMSKWFKLAARFQKMGQVTGHEKSSSYVMNVIFTPAVPMEIAVELGTYDIPGWPRHLYLGPFTSEAEALTETEKKILEAEQHLKQEIALGWQR